MFTNSFTNFNYHFTCDALYKQRPEMNQSTEHMPHTKAHFKAPPI